MVRRGGAIVSAPASAAVRQRCFISAVTWLPLILDQSLVSPCPLFFAVLRRHAPFHRYEVLQPAESQHVESFK